MYLVPVALAALLVFSGVMTFTGAGLVEDWAKQIAPLVALVSTLVGLYVGEIDGFAVGVAAALVAPVVMYLPGVLRARLSSPSLEV